MACLTAMYRRLLYKSIIPKAALYLCSIYIIYTYNIGRSWGLQYIIQQLLAAVEKYFGKALELRPADPIVSIFHWKQRLSRDLIRLHIPSDVVSDLMRPDGLINVLPLVQIEYIPKAIEYIRSCFNEGEYREKLDCFWEYFEITSMKLYDPKLWNISKNLIIIEQWTNNVLERYNRTLHKNISFPRPTLAEFVNVIRIEAIM